MSSREEHLQELRGYYRHVGVFGDGEYVAFYPLMFHWTMIRGNLDYQFGYDNRWCFANESVVRKEFEAWEALRFEGEPEGWHRHPDSGRRRPGGDASQEYIDP